MCVRLTLLGAGRAGNLLQLKQLTLVPGAPLFDARLQYEQLCASSVEESNHRRMENMNSEALTHATGYSVNQTYMQNVVSQSRNMVRVWVGKRDGDVGRNADGSMYVQLYNAVSKVGVELSRVRLHDPGQLMAKSMGSGDWLENLLRLAIEHDALSVLFVFDSMRDGMGSEVHMCVCAVCGVIFRGAAADGEGGHRSTLWTASALSL